MKLIDSIIRQPARVSFSNSTSSNGTATVGLDSTRDASTVTVSADDGSSVVLPGASESAAGVLTTVEHVALAGLKASRHDSRAAAQGALIPGSQAFLRTDGYDAPGDGGAALYTKAASEPAHPGKLQSADGAWWELRSDRITTAMFGHTGKGSDESAAVQRALDFMEFKGGGEVALSAPLLIASTLLIGDNVTLSNPRGYTIKMLAGCRTAISNRITDNRFPATEAPSLVDLVIDGQNLADAWEGIRFEGARNYRIVRCFISNFSARATAGDGAGHGGADGGDTVYDGYDDATAIFLTSFLRSDGVYMRAAEGLIEQPRLYDCANGMVHTTLPSDTGKDGAGYCRILQPDIARALRCGIDIRFGEQNYVEGGDILTNDKNALCNIHVGDVVAVLNNIGSDGLSSTAWVRIVDMEPGQQIDFLNSNGVTLIDGAVPFNSDLDTTAEDLADAINAGPSGFIAVKDPRRPSVMFYDTDGSEFPLTRSIGVGGTYNKIYASGDGTDTSRNDYFNGVGITTGLKNAFGIIEGLEGTTTIGILVTDRGAATIVNPRGNRKTDRIWFANSIADLAPSPRVFSRCTVIRALDAMTHLGTTQNVPFVVGARGDLEARVVPETIDLVRTNGYASAGDGGEARYRRVGTEPGHAGKLRSADGAWWELAEAKWTPAMLGGDPTGSADSRPAFLAALRANQILYLPPNHKYLIDGELTLPDFCHIVGDAGPGASDTQGAETAPKIIFTGSHAGKACITSAGGQALKYAGLRNLTIQCEGTYSWILDLVECVDCTFEHIRMEAKDSAVGGFRSKKRAKTNSSWVNHMQNVQIRLPDASTARVLDIDWSDSRISDCSLTGGIGSVLRGAGAVSCIGTRLDRAKGAPNASALLISKETESPCSHNIIGCEIEESPVGIVVRGDTSGTLSDDRLMPFIDGCHFRCPSGTDIRLLNSSSQVLQGPVIGRNVHTITSARRLDHDPGQWLMDAPPTRVIARSHTAASHSGNTTNTVLATVPVKGRSMGPHGGLRIVSLWSHTGSANAKTFRTYLNLSVMGSYTTSAGAKSTRLVTEIWNRGSVASQVGNAALHGGWGDDTAPLQTASVNTDADTTIELRGQLADAGETITLEGYWIELIPG